MLGVVEGTNDVMPCICVEQCDAHKRTLVEQVSKVRGTLRQIFSFKRSAFKKSDGI